MKISEFRVSFPSLTEVTEVTNRGAVVGTWIPAGGIAAPLGFFDTEEVSSETFERIAAVVERELGVRATFRAANHLPDRKNVK